MLAIGAAVGGAVASWFGRDVAFLANAASFLVAAGLVSLIRRPMQTPRDTTVEHPPMRPMADMGEALGQARRDPVLMAIFASKATFGIGAGIVGLLAILATEELGGGDGSTGLLIGARGVGVALGPLIAARLVGPSLARVLLVTGTAGLVFGVSYLGLSVAPTLAMAAVLALIAHLGGGAQWTLSTYGLQRRAPDAVRGRILAGDFALVTLVIAVSNLAAGALADVIGARPTIAIFAVLTLIASSIYLNATRRIRAQLRIDEAAGLVPAGLVGAGQATVIVTGEPSSTVRLTVQSWSWARCTMRGTTSRAASPSAPSGNRRWNVTWMSSSWLPSVSRMRTPLTSTRNSSGSARRVVTASTSIPEQAPMAPSSSSTGVRWVVSPVPTVTRPPRSLLMSNRPRPTRSTWT